MIISSHAKNSTYEIEKTTYHQTSNVSLTLVRNKIVDLSDVVGALPVGTAQTTSSILT